jgi:MoaA/NifB/PqqE/SkfB family radical SAM enzyme
MDLSIITTYRCNSRCSMCYTWQNPTLPREEISLETLAKIPAGIAHLNLTGGEPTLRRDLKEMVSLLYPKAMKLEISSNGTYPDRLESIIKEYPDVKVRFSLDGFEPTNDSIRGEKGGFQTKVRGLLRLQELGGKDLGFAITIQDDNVRDLVGLYEFCEKNCFELATSALHNGFQFHKSDNVPYHRLKVAQGIEALIVAQLQTKRVKNWFRAYLNLGLIAKILGHERLIPCTAATDFLFIDPWSDVYACNVRPDLKAGNLERQSWDEIYNSSLVAESRRKVAQCAQNCWMVGSARTAMRNPRLPRLPKLQPLLWVIQNKTRVMLGQHVPFENMIDYARVYRDDHLVPRGSFLGRTVRATVETKEQPHYQEQYTNR